MNRVSFQCFYALIFSILCIATEIVTACEEHANSSMEISLQRWAENSSGSYSFVFQRSCFCPEEYRKAMRINVENGDVVAAVYLDDADTPVSSTVLADLYTIEEWFGVISDAIKREADRLEVDYHSKYGYPEKIEIDMRERRADDEQLVLISEFHDNNWD